MASSLETQNKYLTEAGYPILLQVSIAERIFKYPRKKKTGMKFWTTPAAE